MSPLLGSQAETSAFRWDFCAALVLCFSKTYLGGSALFSYGFSFGVYWSVSIAKLSL